MKIGFSVNDVKTELAAYTTIRLAMNAVNRGHEVYLIGAGDFEYGVDEKIYAHVAGVSKSKYTKLTSFLKELQSPEGNIKHVCVSDFDVLMLRADPSTEKGSRIWAQSAEIVFGRLAAQHGVIVVNDPNGLAKAANKIYFQMFPEEVRPRTIITRSRAEIKEFAKQEGGKIVLKPLQGSGGEGVFLVNPEDKSNLNQMIESISRDGYIIAQEYLPAATEGDIRLFVMNGRPLVYKRKYAAFRRIRKGDDMRSNIHAGGSKAAAVITHEHLELVKIVRPRLIQDGMFLVGLDIVGNKLMEINVFSPGGLGSAQTFEKVNFNNAVIDALEYKVDYMKYYRRNFSNNSMATM